MEILDRFWKDPRKNHKIFASFVVTLTICATILILYTFVPLCPNKNNAICQHITSAYETANYNHFSMIVDYMCLSGESHTISCEEFVLLLNCTNKEPTITISGLD
jgi:hypothetical protein